MKDKHIPLRLEIPKSEILHIPEGSIKILSPFRSWNKGISHCFKRNRQKTHSVENSRRMKVCEPVDDLVTKRADHHVFKLAMLPQNASDRTTRDVLQEAIPKVNPGRSCLEASYLHAKCVGRLLEAEVLNDMRVIEITQSVALRLERIDDGHLS